jgi:DNA-binding PadR family transcriptional regulator
MRHTAMVPKGFIRYQVLESLSKKPMSGSEIMNETKNTTDGHWKPSPGSIYPLLAWLQDNGYVTEVPAEQGGMKRYELTDKGKTLLEEQKKIMEEQRKNMDEQMRMHMQFRRGGRFFGPPFMGGLWFRLPPEEAHAARDSAKRLMRAFFELGRDLQEHYSEQAFRDARKILDETSQKLEEISKKLQSEHEA